MSRRPDKVFSPLTAGAIRSVAELAMIILLIAVPFDDASASGQYVAAPMMVTNTVAAPFMRIFAR